MPTSRPAADALVRLAARLTRTPWSVLFAADGRVLAAHGDDVPVDELREAPDDAPDDAPGTPRAALTAVRPCRGGRLVVAAPEPGTLDADARAALDDLAEAAAAAVENDALRSATEASRARFEAVARTVPGVLFQHRIAPDGTISFPFLSRGADGFGGPTAALLQGSPARVYALLHPDDRASARAAFRASAETLTPLRWRGRVETPAGPQWIECAAQPEREADGSLLWSGVVTEINDRKAYEAALVRAKEQAEEVARLKSTFLTNISHEIRTPLTSMIGFSEILVEEVGEEHREIARMMLRGGRRLLDTLGSVLDYAQIESDSLSLVPVELDLGAETREAVGTVGHLFSGRGVRLVVDLPPEGPRAVLDRGAFHRILTNVLANAAKFTPEGEVRVHLSDDEAPVLTVSDTGIGIDASFLPHVFDEFKQESEGIARSFEGAGIGLTITKRLLEMMGGTIEVASRKGEGTEVRIGLPRRAVRSPRRRLLLVENDRQTRHLLFRLLSHHYEVDVAADGEFAVARVREAPYAVVLTNLQLGSGLSGEEVLHRLRALDGRDRTPIVALSTSSPAEDEACIRALGFSGYVSRPFRRQTLLRTLAPLIAFGPSKGPAVEHAA